jgi:hypothetical protein
MHGRELDIVSMPANAVLVFNRRLGEFINGITGKTPDGLIPTGIRAPLPTHKTTWKNWLADHPDTQVMAPAGRAIAHAPTGPVLPQHLAPGADGDAMKLIVFVPSTQPVAMLEDEIKSTPLNVSAGKLPVLIYRDPGTHGLRAFDRRIEEDLIPRFELNTDRKRKDAMFVDADTNTGWSSAGVAVDGDKTIRGRKLKPIEIQEGLYWGVMKFWYPELRMIHP